MGKLIYDRDNVIIAEEETAAYEKKRTAIIISMEDKRLKKQRAHNMSHVCPKCNCVKPIIGNCCE
jgi:hypothetical protein